MNSFKKSLAFPNAFQTSRRKMAKVLKGAACVASVNISAARGPPA